MARDVSTLTIEVKAEDKASATVSAVEGRFTRLGNFLRDRFVVTLGDVTSGLRILADGFASSIRASLEAEDAAKKLDNALAPLGESAGRVAEALKAQASAIQENTRFSDEAVQRGQALLATFTKNEEALLRGTQAAVDLSAAMGVDLNSAFLAIGKASQGQVTALGRYGISVRDAAGNTKSFVEILGELEKKLGGRAQADAETLSGAMNQLSNAVGEFQEKLGGLVTKDERVSESIRSLTTNMRDLDAAVFDTDGKLSKLASSGIDATVRGAAPLGALLLKINVAVSNLRNSIPDTVNAIRSMGAGLAQTASDAERTVDALSRVEEIEQRNTIAAGGFAEAARSLGVTLENDVNAKLEKNANILAQAEDLYRRAIISRQEFEAVQVAVVRANDAATESLEKQAGKVSAADESLNTYADTIRDRVVPELENMRAAATAAAAAATAAASGVFDRSGNELPAGGRLTMGGTRYELPGGGSRLVGFANGQRNPASNLGVNYRSGAPTNAPTGSPWSARFLTDTAQYGTIEAFKVASYGFGPSGAGVSTYGVLPGGRIVLLSER